MTLILGALVREGTSWWSRRRAARSIPRPCSATCRRRRPRRRAGSTGSGSATSRRCGAASSNSSGRCPARIASRAQHRPGHAPPLAQRRHHVYVRLLFRDGRSIGRNIRAAMPLSDEYNADLLSRFAAVVRATVKATSSWPPGHDRRGDLLAPRHQGGVALGHADDISLLPAVGSALVWVPAAAYLIITGEALKGSPLSSWACS